MAHRAEINDCENCNEKDVCEVSNMMNNYGLRCKMFSPYRPLTNADRIRAMTDEELAEFVSGVEAEAIRRAGLFITTGDIKRGKDGWLDWLKQEAGE